MVETISNPLPCIVCKTVLLPVFPSMEKSETEYVQPALANTFLSSGTYGSTVFDPCDGSTALLNVCDDCLSVAMEQGVAVVVPLDD